MNFTQSNHNKGNVTNVFHKKVDSMIQPRNDMVLVRIVAKGKTLSGIAMPDTAMEGNDFIVAAVGPAVKDLEIGERVMVIGRRGYEWDVIPGEKDLFLIKETNVPMVYREEK